MLRIEDLNVTIDGRRVLRGLDLEVPDGQVHAVMGPNGAGKSTLANVIAGREGYEVSGSILLDGVDLLGLDPEERAAAGVFLAFQYPIELPGVGNAHFLRTAVNSLRRVRGEDEIAAADFLSVARDTMAILDMEPSLLSRSVNEGFSGGEKKRNEILQMSLIEPRLAILDETDSGLDIDALRIVARGVDALRAPDRSMVVITHYPRLLELLRPDRVHVLDEGRIARSGDAELALELEAVGYGTAATSGPG